jgi:hypothetical protein
MSKRGQIYLTDKEGSFLKELTKVHNPIGRLRLSPGCAQSKIRCSYNSVLVILSR